LKTAPNIEGGIISRLRRRINRAEEAEKILLQRYELIYGKTPDFISPTRFSEKLFRQMIKTNYRIPTIMTKLSDKLQVRDFVRSRVGGDVLVPLLWHGSNPTDIPFDTLPEKYILKTNHGSGGNVVVNGTPERTEIIKTLREWLATNYYWEDLEPQYLNIKPQIIAEELLPAEHELGLLDYKLWCFHGRPAVIQISNPARSINTFYDANWNKLDLSYRKHIEFNLERPKELDNLITIASELSRDFDFVRVDLYLSSHQVRFGELTFTPVGGRIRFNPPEWDYRLGALW
jgi:hypothetical protein